MEEQEEKRRQEDEEEERRVRSRGGGEGDSETDDSDDDDDYGPTPSAGVWAGGSKLESESERIADGEVESGEETGGDNGDDIDGGDRPNKKARAT